MKDKKSDTEEKLEENQSNKKEYHLVVFKLGDEEFGVDINSVREIIRYPQITRVPNSPRYVLGVINLRGQITTMISLRERFNMEKMEETDDTRALIVEMEDEMIGILVDSVSEVIKVDSESVQSPKENNTMVYKDYIYGLAKVGERLIILLDLKLSFDKEELAKIKEKNKL